ncbi:unnamed protein product [Prorocentrum cordatum]|uniref:Uncharacterized protein n=1 Tax=Prorocentrum cordatum TaxID=2364126 RepID=A0ABN9XHD1_9DINO|nr:unnamed protein product [Polarella glacialis]
MHRGANSNDQLWHRANKHDNLYSATRVIHWRPAEQTRSGNAKYSAALCPPPPPHAPLPPRLAERSGPMLWGPAPVRCAKLEGSARQLLEAKEARQAQPGASPRRQLGPWTPRLVVPPRARRERTPCTASRP